MGEFRSHEEMLRLQREAELMVPTKSQKVETSILVVTNEIGYQLARFVGKVMRRFGSDG